jgi:hypothetical protein
VSLVNRSAAPWKATPAAQSHEDAHYTALHLDIKLSRVAA